MAGEVEEPFRLNFQADSLHSGSISFGRFESEVLCWERRSSFSHNRYLEEVEKCSTPGLVTEKKAYFEAHFRKRRIMRQNSPDSLNEREYQTSDNGISEKTVYDEASDYTDAGNNSARFDESFSGSVHGREQEGTQCGIFGILNPEPQIEVSCDDFDDADYVSETAEVEEASHAKLGDVPSIDSESGIDMEGNLNGEAANLSTIHLSDKDDNQFRDIDVNEENSSTSLKHEQDSSPKEKFPSVAEYTEPRLMPRLGVAKSRKPISNKEFKASANKTSAKSKDVLIRSKPDIKTSEATAQNKSSQMYRTAKSEIVTRTKGVNAIKSDGNESRNRINVDPRHSTLQKVSNRVHQSPNRVKTATKPGTKQENSGLNYSSIERSQRRKEFDVKLQEKMHTKEDKFHQVRPKTLDKKAETKLLTQSHNLRAMPVSSYLRESDRNKGIVSNVNPRKSRTNSSSIRTRPSEGRNLAVSTRGVPKKADPPQASGTMSSHSTVTSDSTPSSPAADTGSRHPSQAGRKKEKEKEKHTILRKNKVPENNPYYKGKTMDEKQKTRTGTRSTYAAFKNSSRTGHLAVGVAS